MSPALMLVFVSDHRWNTHTVVHTLPSFTSPGECVPVRPLSTFGSCSCTLDEHMQLTNEAATVFLQSLSHCELITDDGIRHLGSGPCAHDHLEVIELDNCPLITDASLEHLKSCHSLDRIELYDCQQITRAGIKRLRVSHVELTAARKQQFGLQYWLVRLLYSSECDHSRHPSLPKIKPATLHKESC